MGLKGEGRGQEGRGRGLFIREAKVRGTGEKKRREGGERDPVS